MSNFIMLSFFMNHYLITVQMFLDFQNSKTAQQINILAYHIYKLLFNNKMNRRSFHQRENSYGAYQMPVRQSISSREILDYTDLIEQNQSLRIRVAKYEQMDAYIQALIEKNTIFQEKANTFEKQNRHLNRLIKELHIQLNEMNDLREQLKTAQRGVKIKKEQISTQKSRSEKLIEDLEKVNRELEYQKKKYVELESDYLKITSQMKLNEKQSIKLKTEMKELEVEIDNRSRQEKGLRTQLQKQDSEIQNLKNQLIRANQSKAELCTSVQIEKDEKKKIEDYNHQLARNISLKEKQFENESQKREVELRELQKEKEGIEKQRDTLQQNHEQLLNDHKELRKYKVELEQMCEDLSTRIQIRQNQMDQLQKWREHDIEIATQQIQKQQKLFEHELYDMKQVVAHKQCKIQQLNETVQNLYRTLKKYEVSTDQFEAKFQKLKKQFFKMSEELSQTQSREKLIKNEKNQLEENEKVYLSKLKESEKIYKKDLQEAYDKNRELMREYEERIDVLNTGFNAERIEIDKNHSIQKQRIKDTYEFAFREYESLTNKKLEMLQVELQEYKQRIYSQKHYPISQRSGSKSHRNF